MRVRSIALALAGWLAACPVARAGVYNTEHDIPTRPATQALFELGNLRSIAVPPPKGARSDPASLRVRYLAQTARLEAARASGTFTPTDLANLGACYIRLRQEPKAAELLRRGPRDHFLVQANLATALFRAGQTERAFRTQEHLLSIWPDVYAGWTKQRLDWFRLVEGYQLRLLRARLDEERRAARGGGFGKQKIGLDPIFPGVRFVGPGGTYQAGVIARDMQDRLPWEAYAIVFQLNAWLPWNERLQWLLGEVLNAGGNVDIAYQIFDTLVYGSARAGMFEGLFEHRRVLRPWVVPPKGQQSAMRLLRDPKTQTLLLSFAAPRGQLVPVGSGAIAHEVGLLMPALVASRPLVGVDVPPPEQPQPQTPPPPLNWTHVGVSFLSGGLVAALIGLQVMELRRRRRRATLAPGEPGGVSSQSGIQQASAPHSRG
jgi:hypothetical protein